MVKITSGFRFRKIGTIFAGNVRDFVIIDGKKFRLPVEAPQYGVRPALGFGEGGISGGGRKIKRRIFFEK